MTVAVDDGVIELGTNGSGVHVHIMQGGRPAQPFQCPAIRKATPKTVGVAP